MLPHSVIDQSYAKFDPSQYQNLVDAGWPYGQNYAAQVVAGFATPLQAAVDGDANRHAANNLNHWLNGGGAITNYPVDTMLDDLPIFQQDTYTQMRVAVSNVVGKNLPGKQANDHCKAWSLNTFDLSNPRRWRRVGQYPPNETNPLSITDKDIFPTVQGLDTNNLLTLFTWHGIEFDWYLAQNAFNYSLSVGMVLDQNTGKTEVTWQVYIEDYYGWYDNPFTGTNDSTLANYERLGVGQGYSISGNSSISPKTTQVLTPADVVSPMYTPGTGTFPKFLGQYN